MDKRHPGITAIPASETKQWEALVRSFGKYDAYYLPGYAKAFASHGDGEPLLLYYEGGGLRGVHVVMKRDVSRDVHFQGRLGCGEYFDLSTPYGYGGWLVEDAGGKDAVAGCTALEQLFAAYGGWCAQNRIVSEFVRFHPVLENECYSRGFYDICALGATVAVDLRSQQAVWENMSSQNRNTIRKAVKNGVVVYNGRSPDVYKKFREVYEETMQRHGAERYYYFAPEFYRYFLDELWQHAQVFYAQAPDGEVVAAAIMLAANGRMSYHLSGMRWAYRGLAATNLLLYQAALWGCANGCRTLHLGGGVGAGEDSLLKFKKSFCKGGARTFYVGKKVYDEGAYQRLVGMRENLAVGTGFFPEYRAAEG